MISRPDCSSNLLLLLNRSPSRSARGCLQVDPHSRAREEGLQNGEILTPDFGCLGSHERYERFPAIMWTFPDALFDAASNGRGPEILEIAPYCPH